MPTTHRIAGIFPQDANVTATEAVNVGADSRGFVPNPLSIPLRDLALRPGTHRRVSFRATPGTVVGVMLRASKWWPLDILNASRAPAAPPSNPPGPGPGPGPGPATGPVLAAGAVGTATMATAAAGNAAPQGRAALSIEIGPAIATTAAKLYRPALAISRRWNCVTTNKKPTHLP